MNPDRQTNSGAAVTHRDSESSLPTIFLGQSGESVSDEDDSERRNSAPGQRRGSKLIELFDNKKRKQPIKYRDKQGFVWRRMVQDSDDLLVHSRAPNLGQGPKSLPSESMSSLATSSTLQPRLNLNFTPMSAEQQRKLSQNLNNHVPTAPLVEGGSDSLTSFKSCTSDPNLNNLVPKKVSESYGGSGQPQPQTPAKIPLPTLVVTSRSSKDRTRSPSAPVEHRRSKTGSPPPQALDNKENVIQGVRHLSRDR